MSLSGILCSVYCNKNTKVVVINVYSSYLQQDGELILNISLETSYESTHSKLTMF